MSSMQLLHTSFAHPERERYPGVPLTHVFNLPGSTKGINGFAFVDGLPTSWLKAFCVVFQGNSSVPKLVLLHFEALHQSLINPESFTVKDLVNARDALGIKLPNGTLKTALKLTEGFFSNLNVIDPKDCSNSKITSRGGRPEQHFHALPLVDVQRSLLRRAEKRIEEARHRQWKTTPNLTEGMIEALDGDARRAAEEVIEQHSPPDKQTRTTIYFAREGYQDLAASLEDLRPLSIPLNCDDVRAALFAAENNPDEGISCRKIQAKYGLSLGGVRTMTRKAGFEAVEQVVQCPITSAGTFEKELAAAGKTYPGHIEALVETKASGQVVEHYFHRTIIEALRTIIAEGQRRGSAFRLKIHLPSKYRPAGPQTPEQQRKVGGRVSRRRRTQPVRISRYYGEGNNPSLVHCWLITNMRRLRWQERPNEMWIDPRTGEKYALGTPGSCNTQNRSVQ